MFSLENNLRSHLGDALGYSSARSEFKGEAEVLLDANESPYDTGFNRYPDPQALALRKALANEQNLHENQINNYKNRFRVFDQWSDSG
jgi:histidinol-phosphate aminotransferase